MTVTVSGSSDTAAVVTVLRELRGKDCAPTAALQFARFDAELLGRLGDPVGPGVFTRPSTFTPMEAGEHRFCAYLSASPAAVPLATATRSLPVRLPTGSLTLGLAGANVGEPVTVKITGASEVARGLSVFQERAGRDCAATSRGQFGRPDADLLGGFNAPVGPGTLESSYQFVPREPGGHRICAYLEETIDSTPIALATGTVEVGDARFDDPPFPFGDPTAPGVELIGPAGGTSQSDRRPVFRWHAAAGYTDRLVLLDDRGAFLAVIHEAATFGPRDDGGEEIADPDDNELPEDDRSIFEQFYLAPIGLGRVEIDGGVAEARFLGELPPGHYRWYVERSSDGLVLARGERRRLTLRGPGLTRLKVSARSRRLRSSAKPGRTTLRITAAPFATVRVAVTRAGRTRTTRHAWGVSASGVVTLDWSCRRGATGRHRYTVTASDGFGNQRSRSGSFRTVTRAQCAARRKRP